MGVGDTFSTRQDIYGTTICSCKEKCDNVNNCYSNNSNFYFTIPTSELSYISEEADSCLRYGKLWEEFSVWEHIDYARYKAKRAKSLYDNSDDKNARDDLLDALNSIRFAINLIDNEYKPNGD